MAQQIINVGEVANDGTGEALRDAFVAVNDNFTEIYTAGPAGSNVRIANNTISTTAENSDLILKPDGIGRIQIRSTVVPSIAGVYDIGSANLPIGEIHSQYFYGNGLGLTGVNRLTNGNSTLVVSANGNITLTVRGNVTATFSNTAATFGTDIVTSGNVIANTFVGNIAGNISISGPNTGVVYNDGGQAVAADNFSYNKTTGTVTATEFAGGGRQLTGVTADRGVAPNNWNTLTQMGVYSVNTTSWSGTIGTPVDSQISYGLLEVKNSAGASLQQTFYPGEFEAGDVKVQWNRSYWDGQWTSWVKILNDAQVLVGGEF